MGDNKLSRLRITFVSPSVSMSGGIKVMAIYAKMLAELGHRVVVVSPPAASIPLRQNLSHCLNIKFGRCASCQYRILMAWDWIIAY